MSLTNSIISKQISTATSIVHQLLKISYSIKAIVFSEESNNTASVASSIAGVTSAIAITKPLLRPFTCFLEDLWFYGFHFAKYPDFVILFTKEVDLLNELRIKPQFLSFSVDIDKLISDNDRQVSLELIQKKGPENQYMLESIKDIYTFNLATAQASFTIVWLFCLLLRSLRKKHLLF